MDVHTCNASWIRWHGMEEMVLESTGGIDNPDFPITTALPEASASLWSVCFLLLCASLLAGFFAEPRGFLGSIVVVHWMPFSKQRGHDFPSG
uniref:Expressed protein n=1 Tax=Schizophyllum commune (strain H4-8 / FGSC 9210) TaxID=578458 RepID=D8PMZ7_SCHCM